MSLFDSNIKNTVITANVVKELIYSKEHSNPFAQEDFSEEKLEEVISSITECIYYSCKAGNWSYTGWKFEESIFGLSFFKNPCLDSDTHILYEEKRRDIIQYILNRFKELGYTIKHNESKKCFEINILDFYAYVPYMENFFGKSLRSELVSVSCAVPSSGEVFYMDFPAIDIGVAGVDDGPIGTADACNTP